MISDGIGLVENKRVFVHDFVGPDRTHAPNVVQEISEVRAVIALT